LRLFAGIELDDPVRAACGTAARDLEERLHRARAKMNVRWIPDQNLHITLWFLGHVADEKAEKIAGQLSAAWDVAPFTITVEGAGAFPPSGPARIVWIGVTEGADRLTDLWRELSGRLGPLGFEPERRPYHPHVTIGRVKDADSGMSRKARQLLGSATVHAGSSHVRSMTLFESRLSPGGARYEPRLRVPLTGC
jgi:2'-5' RNA ligase